MNRIKQWLCERYLPAYCKDAMLLDRQKQLQRNRELEDALLEAEAYARGLEQGLRALRRLKIKTEEVKGHGVTLDTVEHEQ